MKWKIDFDDLDDSILDLDDSIEAIDEFCESYISLIEQMSEESSGKFFEAITDKVGEEYQVLLNVKKEAADVLKVLKTYVDKIEEANEWTGSGTYIVDTDYGQKKIEKLKGHLEAEFKEKSNKIDDFIEDYESSIRTFRNTESSINEEEDYKDKPNVISYIKDQRRTIEDDISKYKENESKLEDAYSKVKSLESILDEYI